MKLSTKNSIFFLVVTLGVFSIGAWVFYMQLQTIISEEATEELILLKEDVIDHIGNTKKLPESISALSLLVYEPVSAVGTEQLVDTMRYVKAMGETLPFREIIFYAQLNGQNYRITIGKEVLEQDDLIETIVSSFIVIAIALIIVMIVMNFISSRFLWRPFYRTLGRLSDYDIEKHEAIAYEKSSTTEFDTLSKAVNKMTAKLKADYQNLRSFTENASHELQTPIAVMITKTENLLQSDNLSKEQKEGIYNLNQTAGKLKKLNQTLLLLSKIENSQFKVLRETDVTERVKLKLEQFEDLFRIKNIKPQITIEEHVKLTMDPMLMDTIISNLVGNALKYTSENKQVIITLQKHKFSVSNSGEALNVDPEKLFVRFFKLNQDSESSGLGLALVKQIANTHGHQITYAYSANMHTFEYTF
jgi:signal transduction histidine kinase